MIAQLPLSTDCPQSFTCQLGNNTYQFDLTWNERSQVWVMNISDPVSQNPIVTGLSLTLGVDLLKAYALGIGALVVWDETGSHTEATVTSLGSSVNVYWISPDALPVGYPGSTATA